MKHRLGGLLLASLLTASCAASPVGPTATTGTLKLSLEGLFPTGLQTQALQSGTQARVTVTGTGLDKPLTLTAPITGASLVATLNGIPAGPNRVIAIESLDADGQAIPGGRFRTTAPINEGVNAASISFATTPRGDALAKLLAEGSDLAKTLDATKLQEKIEEIQRVQRVPHFGLIDGERLADALKANGGNPSALSANDPAFVQASKTQRVEISGLPDTLQAEVWIDDPVSPKQSALSNGSHDLKPVKPGVWQVYARAGSLRVGPVPVAFGQTIPLDFRQATLTLAAMTPPRGGAASAVLPIDGKDQLVVAGGVVGSDGTSPVTGSVVAFDGETWTALPPMPTPVSHAAFATKNDQLWVIGGLTGLEADGGRTSAIQRFDATSQTWSTPANLGFPSSNASAGFIGDDLYITAGMEFWSFVSDPQRRLNANDWIYRLEPQATMVTPLNAEGDPELRYARYGAATVIADGKLFVFSGLDSWNDPLHAAEVIDFSKGPKGRVTAIAPIPTPRFGATAWTAGGKIFVAGGVTQMGKALTTVESYDLATGRWDAQPNLRTARGYTAMGMLNGKRILAGGHDGYFLPPTLDVLPLASVEALAN